MHRTNKNTLTARRDADRKALRMAARIATAVALTCVVAGAAHGEENIGTPDPKAETGTPDERVADILRLQPASKGCFTPVTWGPPAPPAFVEDELAGWS
jgi:hypothetical protein